MWSKRSHVSEKELLMWVDGELSRRASSWVDEHLEICEACRSRAIECTQSLAEVSRAYHSEVRALELPLIVRQRMEVQRRSVAQWLALACSIAVALGVAGWLIVGERSSEQNYQAAFPDLRLTPGATSAVSLQDVCSGSAPDNDPAVPDSLKREVFQEYGLDDAEESYEIDFLVTPQLGGAASIRNLWPQPAMKTAWNARAKDELEDRLHFLVCSGKLDLRTAQRELSEDWVAAYKKYFGTEQPRAESLMRLRYLLGTSRMRCSVASSTALREYGRG